MARGPLFAVDAALRPLTLPANAHRVPSEERLAASSVLDAYRARPIHRATARVAGRARLLAPRPNALLTTGAVNNRSSHGAFFLAPARVLQSARPDLPMVFLRVRATP